MLHDRGCIWGNERSSARIEGNPEHVLVQPRNVQLLNMVTRQGALWANTLGVLALLCGAFGVIIEKTQGAQDDLNTIAAGTMMGMLYTCTEGLPGMAPSGLAGLTSLYVL